ncbi:MAG: EAL domain-containing protein, partial [Gammaproteobacteria bacterium]|nr:EAL domain-containing protein [Gammaproteobacteria bacterium]
MSSINRAGIRYSDLIRRIDRLRQDTDTASVALIMGRIDGVNTLNERFGYSIGDRVLETFYKKFAAIARENDLALELSSNSFAFVLHAPRHESHVMLAADKIGRLAAEWVQIDETRVRLDIYMGCALAGSEEERSDDLLRQAEQALQDCRSSDKSVMIFDSQAGDTPGPSSHPLFDAHKAIENGEFRVHFQPQFDLRTGQLSGAEALVRWSGPDGLMAPGSFMNELERARSMIPLLQFVMNNTSREVARWVRRSPNFHMAINSSATDLEDTDLVDVLADVLRMWSLDPARLTLEVTETSLMRNPDQSVATLSRLRQLGIRTSIDDFGTGYSSLS